MSQWVQVSTINAIADGGYERFEFDEVDVLIFREGNDVFAIEDLCTHDGAELCGGLYMNGEIECPRSGEVFAPAKGVIDEQSQSEPPCRPHAGVERKHEAKRARNMRHRLEQHFTLDQRLVNQSELIVLQIPEAAVKQFCRR